MDPSDTSVEYLYLDQHNRYSNGWTIGPSLPRSIGSQRFFQYQNQIMLMTVNFGDYGKIFNGSVTALASPSGNWSDKFPVKVGIYYAVTALVPDHLVQCH